MDIDDICIILKKSNNKFDDQKEFFENNYNKVFMTMGDKENKMLLFLVNETLILRGCNLSAILPRSTFTKYHLLDSQYPCEIRKRQNLMMLIVPLNLLVLRNFHREI